MKTFFKYVLATMTGIIALLLLLFAIFMIMGLIGSISGKSAEKIDSNSVLKLDFKSPIGEIEQDANPFESFANPMGGSATKTYSLTKVLGAIENAKDDDRIEGIYLDLNALSAGFATTDALRTALEDFKSEGKWIVSHSDALTQKAYYLASVADEQYINPEGSVDFRGLGTRISFLKGTLDKLGIDPQVFYVGKFKSATEPLRRTDMSPANKEQTMEFLSDFYDRMLANISESTDISVDQLHNISSNMLIRDAEDAIEQKMITGTLYDDEMDNLLMEKTGEKKVKNINYVSLGKYISSGKKTKKNSSKNKIAVVYAEGGIEDTESTSGSIGGDGYRKLVNKIRKDEKVKAVVLRVNSGGGSGFASEKIWREFEMAKQENDLPFVASMGDVAASGGYYIACNADKIYAEPNTITGSIGVFGVIPNMEKLFKEHLGMTFDGVGTGRFSDFGSIDRPFNEEEKEVIQTMVEDFYEKFLERVSEGRQMSVESVHEVAQGRVWSGVQAMEKDLVDEMGDLSDAIDHAAELADLGEDYKIVSYPKKKDPFQEFMKQLSGEEDATAKHMDAVMEAYLGDEYTFWKTIREIKEMSGVQARLPFEIEMF